MNAPTKAAWAATSRLRCRRRRPETALPVALTRPGDSGPTNVRQPRWPRAIFLLTVTTELAADCGFRREAPVGEQVLVRQRGQRLARLQRVAKRHPDSLCLRAPLANRAILNN